MDTVSRKKFGGRQGFRHGSAHANDPRVRKRAEPATVDSVVSTCLDRALGTPGAAAIWGAWEDAVGAQIAKRADPVRLRGRTLVVAVSSAPWMQELNLMKRTIVTALNARLPRPLIDDLYLVLTEGRVPEVAEPRRRAATPCLPAPEDVDLSALPSELRASFTDVLHAWQRRARQQSNRGSQ